MGGKAFPDTTPVPDVICGPTTRWICDALGVKTKKNLGSTGKKPLCGDIDIAVSSDEWTYEQLVERLVELLGKDNVRTQGIQFNQIYTRVIVNDKPIQVDFMIGNVDLLEFTHWSPSPYTSHYSGSHRTEYLKAVAKAVSKVHEVNGRVIARWGYTLHHDKGLEYSARWCRKRIDGKGHVTKMTSVEDHELAEFKLMIPDALPRTTITDPDQICRELFGVRISHYQVDSYESITNLVKRLDRLNTKKDLIWSLYCSRLNEIGLVIPERFI